MLPIGLSGLIGYALDDKVDWPVLALLAVGAVVGAVSAPTSSTGCRTTCWRSPSPRCSWPPPSGCSSTTAKRPVAPTAILLGAAALVMVGCATGVLAGLLGVGGGIVMVPAMVVGFGIPAAIAKGTSLGVIVPTSMMGTWRNRKNTTSTCGSRRCSGCRAWSRRSRRQISVGMSERASNVLFAALLLFVAIRMLAGRSQHAAQPQCVIAHTVLNLAGLSASGVTPSSTACGGNGNRSIARASIAPSPARS